jgi:hypothetical protein
MSVQKLIASLCYIVCVLPTLKKTYLIWFDLVRTTKDGRTSEYSKESYFFWKMVTNC